MRRILTLLAIVLAAASPGCSDDTTAPNRPPNTPGSASPADGALDQTRDTGLSWSALDPDGDDVTYDLYLGYAEEMPKVASGLDEAAYQPSEPLEYGRVYHWKIVAKDGDGGSVSGPVWSFKVLDCPGTSGTICTWAGTGRAYFDGDGNDVLESSFYWPIDIEFTPTLGAYILDYNNHRVRKVTGGNTLETIMGTDGIGDGPRDDSDRTLPGGPADECLLNHPTAICELQYGSDAGKLLLTAWHNHKLRRYDPATELVYVTIGAEAAYAGDGQDAKEFGRLNQPQQAIEASDGSIYILDQRNQVIRRIDTNNIITTIAGVPPATPLGPGDYNGDGLAPLDTKFSFDTGPNPQPSGAIAFDADGNLYVADTNNHLVRKIDWTANQVFVVAGTPQTAGYSGDGGAATAATLNGPRDVEIAPDGKIYIADQWNSAVRVVDPTTGNIETVAGTGVGGFSGDGGPANQAQLDRPGGIAIDAAGDLYIVDTYNHRIRKVHL